MYDEAGVPLDRFTTQRRLVALLALLVAAGDAGLTRDKLVGLLWPDDPSDRARHSLTQALYAARKASGIDDLFTVSETIRLNLEYVDVDAREFETAIAAGDVERASELYRGPLLDGFYMPSAEFESWLTHERGRLEDRALAAMSTLVTRYEAEAETARAIEVARRMAALRPTDASIAKLLMRLLAENGDRAAALTHARTYTALVRERFDIEPDADVLQFAETVRAGRVSRSRAKVEAAAEVTQSVPNHTPAPVRARGWLTRRVVWIAAATVTAALLVIVIAKLFDQRGNAASAPAKPSMIIAPFRLAAAQPQLGYLSDGMIELLATRFADDPNQPTLDAAATIRLWRDAGADGTRPIAPDSLLAVARRAGASRIITGSVVGTSARVVLSAKVTAVESGQTVASATVEGSTDSLVSLVDRLAQRLLLKQINAHDELSERTTVSLPALRSYIGASAAFGERDYAIALREYERALEIDSTFALAALKLAVTADRLGDFEKERIAIEHAWRARNDLGPRDQAFLIAQAGRRYPALTSVRESLEDWNRAARLAPDRADVWYGLAAASFNAVLHGYAIDRDAITAALERAIALDSTFAQPRILLARVDPSRTVDIPRRFQTAGPAALRRLILSSAYTGEGRDIAERSLSELQSKALDADEAMSLLRISHSLAVLEGNPQKALDVTRSMQRLSPAHRGYLRLRILDALYADGDVAIASDAVAQLGGAVSHPGDAPADACVLGQWLLERKDIRGAESILAALARAPYSHVAVGVHPAVCSELLAAGVAVSSRSRDARVRLQRLDSLDFVSTASGDAATYAHIAIARWYLALNDTTGALNALRRGSSSGLVWPRYRAKAAALERELAVATGRK